MSYAKRPNLFLVGAPKSGTTSLHFYLSQHPSVFMSKWKEPCFLAPDFKSPNYPQSEREYLTCFVDAKDERWIGEATSTYLYSKTAAQAIKDFASEARIIVMLRNPVDMVPSMHAQRLKEGLETIMSLEKALALEVPRRRGQHIPFGFRYPKEYLLYSEIGKYSEQLPRFVSQFGWENIHVIVFDDFLASPQKEFQKVCQFLEIRSDVPMDWTPKNIGIVPRSVLFSRTRRVLAPVRNRATVGLKLVLSERVRQNLSNVFSPLRRSLFRKGRVKVDEHTRQILREFYTDEIERLEMLLGRPLPQWKASR